nr:transposase [Enterococcus hirae]
MFYTLFSFERSTLKNNQGIIGNPSLNHRYRKGFYSLFKTLQQNRQGYQLYQDVLYAVKKRDHSLFEDCLSREVSQLPETYATTLRTFKKFLPQIQNSLRYSYSNGPLECLNNHIKILKRNAYGFRNFYHFKRRIMIRHGKTILTK